jgi:hypothetical protein
VSLHDIVRALGGDLYDGGRRANVPAPNHSAADRSVSLLLEDGRVVVNSFGRGDWRDVLDDLRRRRLIGPDNELLGGHGPRARTASRTEQDRRAAAMAIWESGRGLGRTLSAAYCRGRAIGRHLPGPWALRHASEVPISVYRPRRHRRPALLAGLMDAGGALTAVEITYLTPGGRRATDLRLSRKTVGVAPSGCAVRLDLAAPEMLVGEGVFTTLSASERFQLPAWALLSALNLRAWRAPDGVRSVLIAADRGVEGEASAAVLQLRLQAQSVSAQVALPPEPFGDWNDWADATRRRQHTEGANE